MKSRLSLAIFFLAFLALGSFYIIRPAGVIKTKLISPELLSSNTLGLNQWFPKQVLGVSSDFKISAKAAIFLETKTGNILYAKNIHGRLTIASLVKVMTATLALEHKDLQDKFTVSKEAADMEPDKMLLKAGERLTLKELLYGIFLISANDAAEVLAEGVTGNRKQFLKAMNDKAMQLGMKDSYFVNSTGLDENWQNSYSSAYDLVLLTRYAIRKFPALIDITQSQHIVIPQTEEHQDYNLYSGINLLATYPGVVGFKTGFTPEAGLTLITLVRKDGHEVMGVILGSENRREEAEELLDYSFSKLR